MTKPKYPVKFTNSEMERFLKRVTRKTTRQNLMSLYALMLKLSTTEYYSIPYEFLNMSYGQLYDAVNPKKKKQKVGLTTIKDRIKKLREFGFLEENKDKSTGFKFIRVEKKVEEVPFNNNSLAGNFETDEEFFGGVEIDLRYDDLYTPQNFLDDEATTNTTDENEETEPTNTVSEDGTISVVKDLNNINMDTPKKKTREEYFASLPKFEKLEDIFGILRERLKHYNVGYTQVRASVYDAIMRNYKNICIQYAKEYIDSCIFSARGYWAAKKQKYAYVKRKSQRIAARAMRTGYKSLAFTPEKPKKNKFNFTTLEEFKELLNTVNTNDLIELMEHPFYGLVQEN